MEAILDKDPTRLRGCRVLVVEDEFLVALLLEDQLERLGCRIEETAASLAEAMEAVAGGSFDLAVLDVNLNNEKSFAVAAALEARGTPFLFATGFGAAGIDPAFAQAPVLQKPYTEVQLRAALLAALTSSRSGT
jgi:CheY-like chemotaxis protein